MIGAIMVDEPLAQLSYTLTTSDALAYEALPREIVGWRRWSFLVWLAGAGLVLALLPDEWIGPEGGLRFWLVLLVLLAIFWAVAALVMTLNTHRRARRRIPAPTAMMLRQWPDRLEITASGRTFPVPYDAIVDVTATNSHVFITAPPEVVIVPLGAFLDPLAMARFGEEIDRLSSESAL